MSDDFRGGGSEGGSKSAATQRISVGWTTLYRNTKICFIQKVGEWNAFKQLKPVPACVRCLNQCIFVMSLFCVPLSDANCWTWRKKSVKPTQKLEGERKRKNPFALITRFIICFRWRLAVYGADETTKLKKRDLSLWWALFEWVADGFVNQFFVPLQGQTLSSPLNHSKIISYSPQFHPQFQTHPQAWDLWSWVGVNQVAYLRFPSWTTKTTKRKSTVKDRKRLKLKQ